MEKDDWIKAKERLEAILIDAKDTHKRSKMDIEELEFAISNTQTKIESFK